MFRVLSSILFCYWSLVSCSCYDVHVQRDPSTLALPQPDAEPIPSPSPPPKICAPGPVGHPFQIAGTNLRFLRTGECRLQTHDHSSPNHHYRWVYRHLGDSVVGERTNHKLDGLIDQRLSLAFDSSGRTTQMTGFDAANREEFRWRWRFDSAGRLLEQTRQSHTTLSRVTQSWRGNQLVSRRIEDATGSRHYSWTYDHRGLLRLAELVISGDEAATHTAVWSYDKLKRPLSLERRLNGRFLVRFEWRWHRTDPRLVTRSVALATESPTLAPLDDLLPTDNSWLRPWKAEHRNLSLLHADTQRDCMSVPFTAGHFYPEPAYQLMLDIRADQRANFSGASLYRMFGTLPPYQQPPQPTPWYQHHGVTPEPRLEFAGTLNVEIHYDESGRMVSESLRRQISEKRQSPHDATLVSRRRRTFHNNRLVLDEREWFDRQQPTLRRLSISYDEQNRPQLRELWHNNELLEFQRWRWSENYQHFSNFTQTPSILAKLDASPFPALAEPQLSETWLVRYDSDRRVQREERNPGRPDSQYFDYSYDPLGREIELLSGTDPNTPRMRITTEFHDDGSRIDQLIFDGPEPRFYRLRLNSHGLHILRESGRGDQIDYRDSYRFSCDS